MLKGKQELDHWLLLPETATVISLHALFYTNAKEGLKSDTYILVLCMMKLHAHSLRPPQFSSQETVQVTSTWHSNLHSLQTQPLQYAWELPVN